MIIMYVWALMLLLVTNISYASEIQNDTFSDFDIQFSREQNQWNISSNDIEYTVDDRSYKGLQADIVYEKSNTDVINKTKLVLMFLYNTVEQKKVVQKNDLFNIEIRDKETIKYLPQLISYTEQNVSNKNIIEAWKNNDYYKQLFNDDYEEIQDFTQDLLLINKLQEIYSSFASFISYLQVFDPKSMTITKNIKDQEVLKSFPSSNLHKKKLQVPLPSPSFNVINNIHINQKAMNSTKEFIEKESEKDDVGSICN